MTNQKMRDEQAKADFLAYKADDGDMDAIEWCYFNARDLFNKWQDRDLFNKWQDGVPSGDWIYYPAPNGRGAI